MGRTLRLVRRAHLERLRLDAGEVVRAAAGGLRESGDEAALPQSAGRLGRARPARRRCAHGRPATRRSCASTRRSTSRTCVPSRRPAATPATARGWAASATRSRRSPPVARSSPPTRFSTAAWTTPTRSSGPPDTTPSPGSRWGSACSRTSESRSATRSRSAASAALRSSTGTSITATGPRRSFSPIRTCSRSPCTRTSITRRAAAASTSWERARAGGTNLNIPLPPGSGIAAYGLAFERVVVPALRRFRPELIIVASGFDASAYDPLGRMDLGADDFRALTAALMEVAADVCDGRLLMSHEGGYSSFYVPYCGLAVIEQMSGHRTDTDFSGVAPDSHRSAPRDARRARTRRGRTRGRQRRARSASLEPSERVSAGERVWPCRTGSVCRTALPNGSTCSPARADPGSLGGLRELATLASSAKVPRMPPTISSSPTSRPASAIATRGAARVPRASASRTGGSRARSGPGAAGARDAAPARRPHAGPSAGLRLEIHVGEAEVPALVGGRRVAPGGGHRLQLLIEDRAAPVERHAERRVLLLVPAHCRLHHEAPLRSAVERRQLLREQQRVPRGRRGTAASAIRRRVVEAAMAEASTSESARASPDPWFPGAGSGRRGLPMTPPRRRRRRVRARRARSAYRVDPRRLGLDGDADEGSEVRARRRRPVLAEDEDRLAAPAAPSSGVEVAHHVLDARVVLEPYMDRSLP